MIAAAGGVRRAARDPGRPEQPDRHPPALQPVACVSRAGRAADPGLLRDHNGHVLDLRGDRGGHGARLRLVPLHGDPWSVARLGPGPHPPRLVHAGLPELRRVQPDRGRMASRHARGPRPPRPSGPRRRPRDDRLGSRGRSHPLSGPTVGAWVWERGGPYYGVPVQNYLGWIVTTFTAYVLYRSVERRWTLQPVGPLSLGPSGIPSSPTRR